LRGGVYRIQCVFSGQFFENQYVEGLQNAKSVNPLSGFLLLAEEECTSQDSSIKKCKKKKPLP
jgi:hypothetical protein